jgi:hypothetical protein
MKEDELPLRQRTPIRHWVFDVLLACYVFPVLLRTFLEVGFPGRYGGWLHWEISSAGMQYASSVFGVGVIGLLIWSLLRFRDRKRATSGLILSLVTILYWLIVPSVVD